jgi:hypothetical protein
LLSMSKSAANTAPAPPPASSSASAPPADESGRLAAAVARAERRLRVLEEVSQIGLRLMRGLEDPPVEAKAKDAPADAPRPDPAAAFAKLSRAVRLTVALEGQVEEDLRAALAGEVKADEKRREARDRPAVDADEPGDEDERARRGARERLEEQVELAIGRECETEKEFAERSAAMIERLEWDDAYDDVRGRPFREVVERLCTEIGLDPDWSTWTDDGWPTPPTGVPEARLPWSPFHRPSPKPMLKQNQKSHQPIYELADP